MNKDIVSAWDEKQKAVRDWIATVKNDEFSYKSLLENTIKILFGENDDAYGLPDYERITEIDNGDYQGTLVVVSHDASFVDELGITQTLTLSAH